MRTVMIALLIALGFSTATSAEETIMHCKAKQSDFGDKTFKLKQPLLGKEMIDKREDGSW